MLVFRSCMWNFRGCFRGTFVFEESLSSCLRLSSHLEALGVRGNNTWKGMAGTRKFMVYRCTWRCLPPPKLKDFGDGVFFFLFFRRLNDIYKPPSKWMVCWGTCSTWFFSRSWVSTESGNPQPSWGTSGRKGPRFDTKWWLLFLC